MASYLADGRRGLLDMAIVWFVAARRWNAWKILGVPKPKLAHFTENGLCSTAMPKNCYPSSLSSVSREILMLGF